MPASRLIRTPGLGSYTICTSSTRPSNPVAGSAIWETDTNKFLIYTTATTGWVPPWNVAWGQTQQAGGFGSVVTSGTTEIVLHTSTAFTAVANRRIRITSYLSGQLSVLNDTFSFRVRRGTTIAGTLIGTKNVQCSVGGGYVIPYTFVTTDTTSAGSLQYVLTVVRTGGTGTFTSLADATSDNQILTEDMGPNAAPA